MELEYLLALALQAAGWPRTHVGMRPAALLEILSPHLGATSIYISSHFVSINK